MSEWQRRSAGVHLSIRGCRCNKNGRTDRRIPMGRVIRRNRRSFTSAYRNSSIGSSEPPTNGVLRRHNVTAIIVTTNVRHRHRFMPSGQGVVTPPPRMVEEGCRSTRREKGEWNGNSRASRQYASEKAKCRYCMRGICSAPRQLPTTNSRTITHLRFAVQLFNLVTVHVCERWQSAIIVTLPHRRHQYHIQHECRHCVRERKRTRHLQNDVTTGCSQSIPVRLFVQ